MSDIANQFQLPVISGNVSFYNETEGVTVNPSPVVSVAGIMDIPDIRTMEFKNEGDQILVIGTTRPEMDGSEYHKTVHGVVQGEAPQVNLEEEYASARAVLELIQNDVEGQVTAVHDLSTGGLGVALGEMAIKGDMGASVDLSAVPGAEGLSDPEILFSESHARYLVTVQEGASAEILNTLKRMNVPAAAIGSVKGTSLKLKPSNIEINIQQLKDSYHGVIEKFMA